VGCRSRSEARRPTKPPPGVAFRTRARRSLALTSSGNAHHTPRAMPLRTVSTIPLRCAIEPMQGCHAAQCVGAYDVERSGLRRPGILANGYCEARCVGRGAQARNYFGATRRAGGTTSYVFRSKYAAVQHVGRRIRKERTYYLRYISTFFLFIHSQKVERICM
jgi:hypothetical protein